MFNPIVRPIIAPMRWIARPIVAKPVALRTATPRAAATPNGATPIAVIAQPVAIETPRTAQPDAAAGGRFEGASGQRLAIACGQLLRQRQSRGVAPRAIAVFAAGAICGCEIMG